MTCAHCSTGFDPKMSHGGRGVRTGPSRKYCTVRCRKAADHVRNGRARRLMSNYGLTVEDRQRMVDEQDGRCAICLRHETDDNFPVGPFGSRALVVDHCHQTGQVRGLLCNNCNVAVGLLQDSADLLNRTIEYIGVTST